MVADDRTHAAGEKPATLEGTITFSGVGFAYPTRPKETVLSKLSLTFPAGKTTAIVGSSG